MALKAFSFAKGFKVCPHDVEGREGLVVQVFANTYH